MLVAVSNMIDEMPMSKDDTNLAAEFFVLSALHRLGADATLTLANKKSVDVVVVRQAGDAITIDVKGLAGKTSWPVDNFREGRKNHFVVLVSFLDRISEPGVMPEVYIVPSEDVPSLIYRNPAKNRMVIQRARMKRDGVKYHDAWQQLL